MKIKTLSQAGTATHLTSPRESTIIHDDSYKTSRQKVFNRRGRSLGGQDLS
jgi:hypothetical protein